MLVHKMLPKGEINIELNPLSLPTDAHNVKKRRVTKTF